MTSNIHNMNFFRIDTPHSTFYFSIIKCDAQNDLFSSSYFYDLIEQANHIICDNTVLSRLIKYYNLWMVSIFLIRSF